MKRKYEAMSTPEETTTTATPTPTTAAATEGVVAEALKKFKKGFNASLPPLRLREFYNEDKIKEVSESERKKVFDEFYPSFIKFRGKDMGDVVTELDTGIQKVTDDLLKTNQNHKQEVAALLGKMIAFLCKEYESWLEAHLVLNFTMRPAQLKKLAQTEKERVIKFFTEQCTQWNGGVVQEQVAKLEEKITRIQREIEEYQEEAVASAGEC